MTATDVNRYQLYSRQGALGSLASIDSDRARVQQTAHRATTAAKILVELQREWAELEGVAERLLTRGQAFQHLTLEVERGSKRDVALDAARSRDRGTEEKPVEGAELRGGPSAFRTQRARVGHNAAFRRRDVAKQAPSWLSGSGWPRVVALVLAGSLVAVAAIFAAQRFLPELAVESAPPQAVVEPEQQQGEQAPVPPESDVARERAALDSLPDQ